MVLSRGEFVSSSFVTTSELDACINQAGHELHGAMATVFEDHFTTVTPTTFSLSGSQVTSLLPSDCLKLRGVDFSVGGRWVPLSTFSWEERGRFTAVDSVQDASGDYRFWYIPVWTDLVNASDALATPYLPYHEFLVLDSVVKLLEKEDSSESAAPHASARAAIMTRIRNEASTRDASQQEFCVDPLTLRDPWRYGYLGERRYRLMGRYIYVVSAPVGSW